MGHANYCWSCGSVLHGEQIRPRAVWIEGEHLVGTTWMCSNCEKELVVNRTPLEGVGIPYCPNCGAKMDGTHYIMEENENGLG